MNAELHISLVTCDFSFSCSVFERLVLQTCKNKGLFGIGLIKFFACVLSEINKVILVDSGVLRLLVPLLYSDIVEIQCNASGCITALATTG